jgi:hypothetical protein
VFNYPDLFEDPRLVTNNDRVVALEPAVVHNLIEATARNLFGVDAPEYLRTTADMMDNKTREDI